MFPYYYHLVIENSIYPGYFTEKLVDSVLAGCITFYYGCPDIYKYLDSRILIQLSGNIDKDIKLISSTIGQADNKTDSLLYYRNMAPILAHERKRLLYLTAFPTIGRLIRIKADPDFPHVNTHVINLDRRPDRLVEVTNQLLGIPYTRFSAVDGKSLTLSSEIKYLFTEREKYQKNPYPGHRMIKNVLGCALSHIQLWKQTILLPKENQYTRIFEDDIVLVPDFLERFSLINSFLQENQDWDLLFLGYLDDRPLYNDHLIATKSMGNIFQAIHKFNKKASRLHGGGTHAYCISQKGANKLLNLIDKFGINQPIDWFMIEMFSFVNAYKCIPQLVRIKDSNDTDIQNSKESL
jgi:GR25 family glycosyltransferase involved in LPS biosynthesis